MLEESRGPTYSEAVIPPLEPESGNLPPGVHAASWAEVVERFGHIPHRRRLLDGLRRALDELRNYGCRTFYLDGSFVTAKEIPGDWDGCWDVAGVDVFRLAATFPLLWDDVGGRINQKAEYGGDIFPIQFTPMEDDHRVLREFQTVPATGQPKGVIVLDLETL